MGLGDGEGMDHLAGLGMGSLAAIGGEARGYQRAADTGEDGVRTETVWKLLVIWFVAHG